jgi:class 3 adenylate cyclase
MNRRLAAILAADIAGYSRLMHEDEASTVRDLKAHQSVVLPLIPRHGGRIIDTAGDGILAEFPSVVGATECAIEIQTVMVARNETVRSRQDLASAYAWRGQNAEAAAAVAEILKLRPGLTVQQMLEEAWAHSDNETFRKEYQRIAEGVRKAGLPER